ncbi:MAG: Polyphosphate kinase [Fibrobacterota bacterium]|jgi:polyphosphate kinase
MASRSGSSHTSELQRFQREYSWLAFNQRVLEEAESIRHPLLERIKFLSIFSSNLEEFFMVRVAGHRSNIQEGLPTTPGEIPSHEVLEEIRDRVIHLEERQSRLLQQTLLPELAEFGVKLVRGASHADAERIFDDQVLPVLTPMGVDPARPFPTLQGQLLHLCIQLRHNGVDKLAFIPFPKLLGRFLTFSPSRKETQIVPIEDFTRTFLSRIFQGHEIVGSWSFQILRDMDMDYEEIEDDSGEDFLEHLKKELGRTRDANVVRLVHEPGLPEGTLKRLKRELEIDDADIYTMDGHLLNLAGCFQILRLPNLPSRLFDAPLGAKELPLGDSTLFQRLAKEDILLHHPFESYSPVLRFLQEAARDPDVLAIKQTLYRVSDNSGIVAALIEAAQAGKHVSVLVEIKARFDESRNIAWARSLEDAGVHVVYGLLGLKTHCKVALVVRKEPSGIRRYAHFGTGNYNENSAKLYTDISLLTSDEDLCSDAGQLLNVITGFSEPPRWEALAVAPQGLRARLLELIHQERQNAKDGKKALVMAKMNALVDNQLIKAIEEAAKDGVEFRLLVRGICCLVPNGKSGPGGIQVRSVVDRFLEHSRIYHFHQDGKSKCFIASADWMPRNMDRRIEVMAPIRRTEHRKRLKDLLDIYWDSDTNTRELLPDGRYMLRKPNLIIKRAQELVMQEAQAHHEVLKTQWNPPTTRRGPAILQKRRKD